MKRSGILIILAAVLLAALPASAGLPGLTRPTRPVSDLRCVRDASDVVLTWTTTPAGTYRSIVVRGLLHPRFRAEKVVAILPPGTNTWRDVGAVTRTALGATFVNEFYRVYAAPGLVPVTALAPKTQRDEYTETPRNRSQIVRQDVSNGEQFSLAPTLTVVGRDNNWQMEAARTPDPKTYLWDLENAPTPGGATGRRVQISGAPAEAWPATVDHQGYAADVQAYLAAGDQDAPGSSTRALSAPAVVLTGTAVSGTLTPPTQDTAGTWLSLDVYRTYEGVGPAEPGILVATLAPDATSFTDDLAAVTPGWYVFYAFRITYIDGSHSDFSASSAPIRR